ncbi:MAG: DUF748 domain-containing protein, partial [Pontibacter sp.]|nr:DUF748 domain-containing protein [Pontibacter sp.]
INLNELSLQQPKLLITVMRRDTTEQNKPIHETVSDFMKGLHIGKIDVNNAWLRYREEQKTDAYLFAIRSFNLTVDDFRLDSQSFQAEERAYYAKQMRFAAAKATYQMPDGLYKIEADSLFMSTQEQALLAKQVSYTPLGSAANLSKAKGRAVTGTSIKVPLLRISGLDYQQHSLHNRFMARHVLLSEPSLDAFKDKQSSESKGRKPLPHEMVQNIKTPFHIDSVVVRQGYVRYTELVPKAEERGHITFNSLDATLTNLTNIPEQISIDNPAVIQASTLVMGKAPLSVTIRLPLLQENGYHTLRGNIGEANPEIQNSILVPTSFIRIESGHISRGEFSAELTNDRANGTMKVIYSNLSVEMLSKGSGGEQGLGMEILSEVVDWVAIKDSNPMEGEQVRIGNITVTRNAQKSVFNYWKNCLASGFISSMGLKSMAKK